MPYKRGPKGEQIPLSPEELNAIYQRCEKNAREVVSQKAIDTENLQAEVAVVNRAWEERLNFLVKRVELLRAGGKEADAPFQAVLLEISVRDAIIFNAFQDLNIFIKWLEMISQDAAQAIRAYGFAVRLAERLGVAKNATRIEKETILSDLNARKRPSIQVVIYRNEFKVPVNPENELHKRVFYRLEGLRRAAKAAM